MATTEMIWRKNFGDKLRDLMRDKGISDKKLESEFKERGHKFSYTYINRIGNGRIDASEKFVKAVAEFFEESEKELLCIAGLPPYDVLGALSSAPHKFLSLIEETLAIKIGVVEILWAAHIFAVPKENLDWVGYTQFECVPFETGREALSSLLDDKVQFATVTKAAIEHTKGKDDIFPILDFLTSRFGSLYYLYKVPDSKKIKRKSIKYGFLTKSVLVDVATQYITSLSKAAGNIQLIEIDTLEELIDALANESVQGFFGWPPLNDKVTSKLREKAQNGLADNLFASETFEFDEEDINPPPALVPTLYLVTTHSFVKREGSAVMTDLVSRIIKSRTKISNIDNNDDYIWAVLKEYMPYLSEKTKEKLFDFSFDANIESEAFKLMVSDRSHWATTSQKKNR